MSQETRYWDRVGMYVTKEFAEEWVEKIKSNADGTRGKYLDDDVEEYVAPAILSTGTLQREVEQLFEQPYESVELPPSTQSILVVAELERNKVIEIKKLKSKGYSLQEAKEMVTSKINQAVAEIMGIDLEDYEERQNEYINSKGMGAEAQEASVNDGEE
tara:strand:- start:3358 stop:3834 length:477 start_codon:yes stop_codon:yes gene_type:complete